MIKIRIYTMVSTQNAFSQQVEQLTQQYNENQNTIERLLAEQQQNIYTINNKKHIVQQYKQTAKTAYSYR